MRTLLSLLLLSKAFQLFDCFFLSSFLPSLFLFFFFGGGGGEGHAWLPVLALNIQFSCLHLLRAGITRLVWLGLLYPCSVYPVKRNSVLLFLLHRANIVNVLIGGLGWNRKEA
jgi:hypothetical protein